MPRIIAFIGLCASIAVATPFWYADTNGIPNSLPLHLKDSSSHRNLWVHAAFEDSLSYQYLQNTDALNYQEALQNVAFFDGRLYFTDDDWFFKTGARVSSEWTTAPVWMDDYEPFRGIPFNPQKSGDGTIHDLGKRTSDYFSTLAQWNGSWITIFGGLDWIQTGPAVHNHLLFDGDRNRFRPWNMNDSNSHQSPPVLFGAWDLKFQNLRYRQWSGELAEDAELPKYFHNQRLDISGNWWNIGVSMAEVYGSSFQVGPDTLQPGHPGTRSMQWVYTIPFVPYYFAQHFLGNQDNSLLDFDGEVRWNGFRFYSELLIDDMKPSLTCFFSDSWWGDKFANSSGLEYIKAFDPFNIRVNYEHTHIEPWVYTHTFGTNYTWDSYGQPLGSDLGPNSSEDWFQFQIDHLAFGSLSFSLSNVSKGFNKGSSIGDIHYLTDPTTKEYLPSDSTHTYQLINVGVIYPIYNGIQFKTGLGQYFGYWHGTAFQISLRAQI